MIELSVVVPTYNKPEILKMTLESLARQTLPKNQFEVIVIDDGSFHSAQKKIKSFLPNLGFKTSFLIQRHKGPAAARNKGIKRAKGEIVLIINDDTIATSSLLKRHYDFHRKNTKENFGLLGYVTWHPDLEITPFMYWLEHGGPYFSFKEIKGKEAGWERLWTCNVSFKKEFLLENGLFDEEFPYAAWEDVELGYRLGKAGLKVFYDRKAVGYHYHPTTIKLIQNKMKANGESAILLREKLPQKFLPPLARPSTTRLALILDSFFSPLIFLLEKLALWVERRVNLSLVFDLVLLHYRIKGVRKSLKVKGVLKNYDSLLAEEMEEWEKIEKDIFAKGVPWWVDLRRAKIKGKDIFWRNDPKKEKIIRGEEKERLIKMTVEKGGRVLDLGCGSGWLSLELARNGLEVIGIDASPVRIKIAKKFLKENPYKKGFGKLKYIQADVNRITFPRKYFNTMVAWDILHHFPNLEEILVKSKVWLKPGGGFITFDHIGNKFLKLGDKILRVFSKKARESKIIPYEDVLGKEIITLLKKNFQAKILKTRLAFPISALLYLVFSKDIFLPILSLIAKIDRMFCNSRIFCGEYFFFYGTKNEDSHR